MNKHPHILIASFYLTIKDEHQEKYPQLNNKLKTSINKFEQTILQQLSQIGQEELLLRFHYCCLIYKDIKRALLLYIFYLHALAQQDPTSQLFVTYEIINKTEVYSQLCGELSRHKIKDWKIYLLLAQLLTCQNYIEESITPLHKAVEINKQCEYAYIDLALIYSLSLQRQYALIYLKKIRHQTFENAIFCQLKVIVLLLCEQYQTCLQLISKCCHSFYQNIQSCQAIKRNRCKKSNLNTYIKFSFFEITRNIEQTGIHRRQIKLFYNQKTITSNPQSGFYSLIRYLLQNKWRTFQFLFIFLNTQSPLNSSIFKAVLELKNQGTQIKQLKLIENQFNNQNENMSQYVLPVKTRNRLWQEQIKYGIYYNIAAAYVRLQAYEQATHYLLKAIEISNSHELTQIKRNDMIYSQLAKISQINGANSKALEYCQYAEIQSKNYLSHDCIEILAIVYFKLRKMSKAFQLFELSIILGQINENILYFLCMSLYYSNQIEYAINKFHQFIKLYPNQKMLYFGIAELYADTCQRQNAVRYFQKSLQLNQQFCNNQTQLQRFQMAVFHWIGILYQMYQPLKSIYWLSKSVQLYNYQSVLALGRLYHTQKRFYDENLLYQRMQPKDKNHPYYSSISQHKGYNFIYLQRYQEALDCFNQQNISYKIQKSYNGQALVYKMLKQYQKAIQYSCKALQINCEYLQCYKVLSQIFIELNQKLKNQIIQVLKSIEEKNLSNNTVLLCLSIFWNISKQINLSILYFEKLFKIFKENYDIQKCLCDQFQRQARIIIHEYNFIMQIPSSYFSLQRLLLYKLLNNRYKCHQQIGILLSIPIQLEFQLISWYRFIKHFVQKEVVLEYLIKQILRYNHQKGIAAVRIAIKENLLDRFIGKIYINLTLRQSINKIQKASLFLSFVLKKDKENLEKYFRQQEQQSQFIQNINKLFNLNQYLKNSSEVQQNIIQYNSLLQILIKRVKIQSLQQQSLIF